MMKNKILKISFIIIGIILVLYSMLISCFVKYRIEIIAVVVVGILFIIGGLHHKWLIRQKFLLIATCVIVFLFAILIFFLAMFSHQATVTYQEDVILVLGSGLDGDRVTKQLANRLDKALEVYNNSNNAIIVVSGGQGTDEQVSEAYAMEQYLVNKGVSYDRIIREETSTSTYSNIHNSQSILNDYFDRPYTVALVTSDYHIYRANMIASSLGIECKYIGSSTEWYEIPIRYARECFAVIKLWLWNSSV